ncbi:hypothetical protein DNTS_034800, partial [Danionella cerebrum]
MNETPTQGFGKVSSGLSMHHILLIIMHAPCHLASSPEPFIPSFRVKRCVVVMSRRVPADGFASRESGMQWSCSDGRLEIIPASRSLHCVVWTLSKCAVACNAVE